MKVVSYTPPARRRVLRVGLKVSSRNCRLTGNIFLPRRRETTNTGLSSPTDLSLPGVILCRLPRHPRYAIGTSYCLSAGMETREYFPCSVNTKPYAQLGSSHVSKKVTQSKGISFRSSTLRTRPGALRPMISSWGRRAPRILIFSRLSEISRNSWSSGYAVMSLRDVYTRKTLNSGSSVRSSSNLAAERFTRFVHPPTNPSAMDRQPRRSRFPVCTSTCLQPCLRHFKLMSSDGERIGGRLWGRL